MRRAWVGYVLVLASCAGPARRDGAPGASSEPMLAALPKPAAVNTARFTSVVVCDRCHTAGPQAMRDRAGRDVSPVAELRTSMMGLAARDPYYLAALRRELAANPGAKSAIEATCLRCHAPVGFAEADGALTLDDLLAGTTPAAGLARDGAGCLGCHAADPDGLGTERTFVGAAKLRTDRVAYGAQLDPFSPPMIMMSNTKPVPARHVSQSRLCASCHTVLVHRLDGTGAPVGDEIPEQTTYLEWRNSEFQDEAEPHGRRATTCQGCHMPATDDAGAPIRTAFSTRPPESPVRDTYRRHVLRGGNAYLLEQLAKHTGWLGTGVTADELRAAAAATRAFLGRSAKLELRAAPGGLAVTVINETGHKLPTGYPTRRMWLHVTATDAAGAVVFESGRADATGALVDSRGTRLDAPGAILPHRSVLDSPDQVLVWEAVPVDAAGQRTHLLLGTAAVVKDNRLLPAGWRADHPDGPRTRAIGVDGDADFVAGRDTVTVKLPASARAVTVELLYQPIPPETLESYPPRSSLEAARFRDITRDPPRPELLARASLALGR